MISLFESPAEHLQGGYHLSKADCWRFARSARHLSWQKEVSLVPWPKRETNKIHHLWQKLIFFHFINTTTNLTPPSRLSFCLSLLFILPRRAEIAKVLLKSSYAPSLCTLTTAAVAAAREAEIPLEQSCMNISELLKAIADAGSLSYRDSTAAASSSRGGKRVRGRVLIAEHALPALMDALLLIK